MRPQISNRFLKLVPQCLEPNVLDVFNWTDYIGETTIEDFQTATGIEVTKDLYDSTETMEAKMLSKSSDFDVVIQAGSTLERAYQVRFPGSLWGPGR